MQRSSALLHFLTCGYKMGTRSFKWPNGLTSSRLRQGLQAELGPNAGEGRQLNKLQFSGGGPVETKGSARLRPRATRYTTRSSRARSTSLGVSSVRVSPQRKLSSGRSSLSASLHSRRRVSSGPCLQNESRNTDTTALKERRELAGWLVGRRQPAGGGPRQEALPSGAS